MRSCISTGNTYANGSLTIGKGDIHLFGCAVKQDGAGGVGWHRAGWIGGRGWRSGDVAVSADPFRQVAAFYVKNARFARELDPSRQFNWRAEGGAAR
jgi:hypothetical protein